MKQVWSGLLLAGVVGLVGCTDPKDTRMEQVQPELLTVEETAQEDAAQAMGSRDRDAADAIAFGSTAEQQAMAFQGHPLDDPDSVLAKKVVYFDFDSSRIHEEDMAAVNAHAAYLAANPNARVKLEGHGDERGSREYNVALGERRAQSVEQILKLQGVGNRQISVVSYGEERPAVIGHDESAWRYNRRVEIIYQQR